MLAYLVFYSIVIIGFALIASRSLIFDPNYTDADHPISLDSYRNNYSDLSTMIYGMYTLGSNDNYPENETLAYQNSKSNAFFFVVFIFFNMFLFASIPGTLIYNKFR